MIKSPLRWAGSKANVMSELNKYLRPSERLVDLFVGGGTVFLNTNYTRYTLCDSNFMLMNFYRELTTNTDIFIDHAKFIFNDYGDEASYYAFRNQYRLLCTSLETYGKGDKGAAALLFLYLNRHCYGGVYRCNDKGEFNMAYSKVGKARFPEKELRLFAEKANDTHATFLVGDFRQALSVVTGRLFTQHEALTIYADPPYFPLEGKRNFNKYGGKAFEKADHEELNNILIGTAEYFGTQIVLSNSDTKDTREAYAGFEFYPVETLRKLAPKTREKVKELIGIPLPF